MLNRIKSLILSLVFLGLAGTCGSMAYRDVQSATQFYSNAQPAEATVVEYTPGHVRPGRRQALQVVHNHGVELNSGGTGVVKLDRQYERGATVPVHYAPRSDGGMEIRMRVSEEVVAKKSKVFGAMSLGNWAGYGVAILVLSVAAFGYGLTVVTGKD